MTEIQILQKAIEKAKQNGFQWATPTTEDAISEYIGMGTHYWTIFSHNFAKALWGEEQIGEFCPRCGCEELDEHDCGPDGYDDDIAYTSYSCDECGLWYDGWRGRWLINCDSWIDEEDAEIYKKDELWQYHLQQMVLEQNPIQYLKKFI